jgi:uncharacterized protein with PIN domain
MLFMFKIMEKEKLEWLIETNERMGGDWWKIKEQQFKCPICNGKLFSVQHTMKRVMDGNTVIHCEDNEHTFFKSSWDTEVILYQNDNASETTSKYDKEYKYTNGVWVEI